jgi:hypothetical protein
MFKKVLATLAAMGVATSVYAACSTHTYMVNGKMMTCTTCCNYGNCTTTCF